MVEKTNIIHCRLGALGFLYLKDHIKWNNELFEFLEVETLEYLKPEMQHKRNYIIDKYKEDFNLLKKIYRPYNKRLFKFLGFKIKEWV